ncbi:TetR/AcrR family transcriptional regulator C-terminal domain-containing protein [Catellatospora methionotrophica]|uniref:TetR/AcrR family transcriptional regulator C-terminal domain-containing protein n=1 Tax=Catellatospora methionotrophica TaxID=121620 RepID=UPI001407291C|nr:TetR/AcrR family transcriptional regulator C-terminal domain-containing protein [Catellatospora methionotrophica]
MSLVTRGRRTASRPALSRDRVLRAAVEIADEAGIAAVTMRRLAENLGAEAMSLYHHVANKDQVLDGVVDVIAAEINEAVGRITLPTHGAAWKAAARERILTARQVLLRHKWAPALFESRSTTSPAVLLYFDGLVGIMRDGGFSNDLAHHAMHALGSRAMGFSQELFSPGDRPATGEPDPVMAAMAARLPHLVGMLAEVMHDDPDSTVGWCDDQSEFEFGLDLLLEGLDRRR